MPSLRTQLRNAFRIGYGLWGTFGIVLGGVSIFNLLVTVYRLGLPTVLRNLVSAYQWTFHTVLLEPIWTLVSIHPPDWANDCIVIWLSGASISYRTLIAARDHARQHGFRGGLGDIEMRLFQMSVLRYSAIIGITSLMFWPLLWIRYIYAKPLTFQYYILAYHGDVSYRTIWLVQVLSIATLVVLLLVTSAGLPPS